MTPTTITACLDLADRTLGEIMRSAVDPNAELTERAALVAQEIKSMSNHESQEVES